MPPLKYKMQMITGIFSSWKLQYNFFIIITIYAEVDSNTAKLNSVPIMQETSHFVEAISSSPITLGHQLLNQYAEKEKSKNLLKRNLSRLTANTIGNQSKLPQVVRNEKGKRSKLSLQENKVLKHIAEEEINDFELVRSMDTLKNCCCHSDSTTNCIRKNFSLNGSKNFDFTALCKYVRK